MRLLPSPFLGLATVALAIGAGASRLPAQRITLPDLLAASAQADARRAQLALADSQAALRRASLNAERLPSLQAQATGQYVSDVPSIGGVPVVPYQQYDAYLMLRQRLWDPTRSARRGADDAQAAEAAARIRGTLWQRRQAVSDAFFTVLALDAEQRTLEASNQDLDAQLALVSSRVSAGVALPGDRELLAAERLRLAQRLDAVATDRRATLEILRSLSGVAVGDDAQLEPPNLDTDAAATLAALDTLRERAEFAQFDAARAALDARARASTRQDLPRVSAFGRGGYGRPGINPLARDFQSYWIIGVQLEWSLLNWRVNDRDAEVQLLQREMLRHDETTFREQLERAVTRDRATAGRLERALESDSSIVAIHSTVLAETERRFREGTATGAEYTDRLTDLLTARIARDRHRVQLAETRARILITLGQELH
ncbi:MAG: TolC family protein [Gemmatimonadaceae bacterium]|nr:TolC family protein [Gemmatimonadaceae bacterium]